MHVRAVTCRMCHNKFFPASLKFHVKVCSAKQEHMDLPCDFCDKLLPASALQMHMKMCGRGHSQVQTARQVVRRRVKDTKVPGQRQPDEANHNPHAEAIAGEHVRSLVTSRGTSNPESAFNTAHASTKHIELEPLRGLASGWACSDKEYVEGDSGGMASGGRVACSNCLRNFSSDRVAVHQDICYRINTSETRSRIGINRTVATAVGSIRRSSCSPLRTEATKERRARRGFSLGRTRDRARAPPVGTAGDPTTRRTTAAVGGFAWTGTRHSWKGVTRQAPEVLPGALSRTDYRENIHESWRSVADEWQDREHLPVRLVSSQTRPSSAAQCASVSITPGRKSLPPGRIVSSSWSPVRGRRASGTTSLVWRTRGRGYARSYVSDDDSGGEHIAICGPGGVRDLNHCGTLCVPGRSDADDENFVEMSAGRTFFSPSCAGRRIRLF